jgi:hypothetical protein
MIQRVERRAVEERVEWRGGVVARSRGLLGANQVK